MNSIAKPFVLQGQSSNENTVKVFDAARVRAASYVLTLPTQGRTEIHDLTPRVRHFVTESSIREGMVSVTSFHTTTAVLINENQAALMEDFWGFVNGLLPRAEYYRHNDPTLSDCDRHNADAHLKAVLLGQSKLLSIVGGELILGQWQSVLFAEFDGPQPRKIHVHIFGT